MSKGRPPRHEALWGERDEIQRLDFVAGVVAPTSLAGCVASAALIATGHLVDAAAYVLGAAGLALLVCAAMATLSLAWSPLEAVQAGKKLGAVIRTKRSRTNKALAGLVLSVVLGFGTTAVLEVADTSNSTAHQERSAHPKSSGADEQQGSSRTFRLYDQFAGQDEGDHHRRYQPRPVVVELVHRSQARIRIGIHSGSALTAETVRRCGGSAKSSRLSY